MKLNQLNGIVVPLVTPFNNDGSIDLKSLEVIINHVIDGGVKGIFILGTTGEFASMTLAMKEELIDHSSRLIQGRVISMVGVSSCDFQETKRLIKCAEKNGIDAIVASPPYYYPLGQDELLIYYKEILASCNLPLYLYNMPSLTKVVIEPETVRALANLKGVVGLKDSSANMNYLEDVMAVLIDHKDFQVFIGPEEKLDHALQLGVTGGVNGGANLFPSLYVELYDAFKKGKMDSVNILQQKIYEISEEVYHLSDGPSSYLQGLKAAMSIKGLCKNVLLFPLETLNSNQVNTLATRLNELG